MPRRSKNLVQRRLTANSHARSVVVVVVVVVVVCSIKRPTPKDMRESLLPDGCPRPAVPRAEYQSG